jgi:hypothetical protein
VLQRQVIAVARFGQDLAIIRARVLLPQKQRADAGFLQHVAQFVRAVGGIHVDQHDSGARRRVLQEDPLDAVAGPDAGAVARAQSQAREAACRAGDFAVEFAPREAHVLMAHHQRFAVGKSGGGMADCLGNGLFQQGHGRPADIR